MRYQANSTRKLNEIHGHGQFIVDSKLRQAYEAPHPDLPKFAAAAIKTFAEREL
jgi:hypothetical protein